MPLTRTQGEAALKHVILIVMDQPDDGKIMKSLKYEDIDHISDIMSLRDNDIENLKFLEDDGNTLPALKSGHRGML
jgi:hypothetical protein